MQRFIPGLRTRVVLSLLAAVLGFSIAPQVINPPTAHAQAPACGTVLVAAKDWMGGTGVDVRHNGAQQNTGNECKSGGEVYNLSANPPQYGFGWQCVELINRLYASKGWFPKLWLGSETNYGAKYLYDYASAGKYEGLTAHANGSGYKPVQGDIIVHSNGTYGHASVVESVFATSITAAEQNASSSGLATYGYNAATGAASKTGATISGYIHADKNTAAGGGTPVSAAPKGFIDGVHRGPGGIVVHGWASDPDTNGPIQVHAYSGDGTADNRNPVASTWADIYRPDMGNHGFRLTVPNKGTGLQTVCAYGVNNVAGAPNSRLGDCKQINVSSVPFGNLESATRVSGGIRVTGWSIDPDTKNVVWLHVYGGNGAAVGGNPLKDTYAGINRADLLGYYPDYGAAHGFDVVLPTGTNPQTVCVYAIDNAGGQNAQIGCRNVA